MLGALATYLRTVARGTCPTALEAELDVLHTFGSPARAAIEWGPQAPSPHTP
jgi:hypothetical protein